MNKIYNDNLRTYTGKNNNFFLKFLAELSKLIIDATSKNEMEVPFPASPEAYRVNRFDLDLRMQIFDNIQ